MERRSRENKMISTILRKIKLFLLMMAMTIIRRGRFMSESKKKYNIQRSK
jgi:hypothetical protein